MSWRAVQVRLSADVERAENLGARELVERMLRDFQQQGESWQRECAADPMIKKFLRVEVITSE